MFSKLKLTFISALVIIFLMQVAFVDAARSGVGLSSVTLVGGGEVQDAADIPMEPQFKVRFDKNVVNSVVWDGNSTCFSLVSTDNTELPIRVTKVDDTIDDTQKQNIFVQPEHPLTPGTAYYLKIAPTLKAKNGTKLGVEISIAFKTTGEAPVPIQPLQPVTETLSQDHTDTTYNPAILADSATPTDSAQEQSE